ncbi:hypothetical protein HGRIS_000891 [Hohenbuehelia grisea]|uniref:Uncharacterized protein n=1 Tax=Hohenbuehelia grisea TaxID=104357 RepID=A0ABR3IQ27_9AGAR
MSRSPSPALGDASEEQKVEQIGVTLDTHTGKAADPDPTVGNNVIGPSHDASSSAQEPVQTEEPSPTMPRVVSLSDLDLHSPSQIIGTPFAVNSSRFEYPFPETSSPSSQSSSSFSQSPQVLSSSFPYSSTPISPPLSGTSPPSFTSYFQSKLRLDKEPPMPPSLAKKRFRWSMGLLGRRKESYESQKSEDSVDSAASGASLDSMLLANIDSASAKPQESALPDAIADAQADPAHDKQAGKAPSVHDADEQDSSAHT